MRFRHSLHFYYVLVCALLISGCSGTLLQIPYQTEVEEPPPTAIKVGLELGGNVKFFKKWLDVEQIDISGMARMDNGDFLLVHDSKNNNAEQFRPRLGVLAVDPILRVSTYREIRIDDTVWDQVGGPANDLEAVCGLPLSKDEFLLLESSYYEGRYGRIFHVRLHPKGKSWKAEMLGAMALPKPIRNETPYNFEGMGCIQGARDAVEVVLGDRGHGKQRSRLLWNTLDLKQHRFLRGDHFKTLEYSIRAPVWEALGETDVRHISDLYIDKLGRMWIASSYEGGGDFGPFASVVYMAGYASPGHILPVDWNPDPVYQVKIGGIKIEALGPPLSSDCLLSVGSDDEGFGGQFGEVFCKDPNVEVYSEPLPTN